MKKTVSFAAYTVDSDGPVVDVSSFAGFPLPSLSVGFMLHLLLFFYSVCYMASSFLGNVLSLGLL